MDLFLAPHNDDETLFGAYTLLAHHPKVVVVLRSVKQETAYGFQHQPGFTATGDVREAESREACRILGCEFEQWDFPDDMPDWQEIEDELSTLANGDTGIVYAPTVEADGHPDHNRIGELADFVFGPGCVTHYMTYTNGRSRSDGIPVAVPPDGPRLKAAALACYRSQLALASTAHHFVQPHDEYYAPSGP